MFDLGTSFVASVERDPDALAIADGEIRLSYRDWYARISALVSGFDELGLRSGDRVVTVLQNNWQAATIHWACQLAGIIITPLNWRSSSEELDFCLEDAEAKAIIYENVSARSVEGSAQAGTRARIAVGLGVTEDIPFESLMTGKTCAVAARADPEAWSVMLYTSGTTARPKGVPRRHRAERAAALAHVAQNLYGRGERTLGVMPLYHTMGVRSLIAMSLIGGSFVCLPRFDAARALQSIAAEKITNLYLVPTLYHDLLHYETFSATRRIFSPQAGLCRRAHDGRFTARLERSFPAGPVRQSLRVLGNLYLHSRAECGSEARLRWPRGHQSNGAGGSA